MDFCDTLPASAKVEGFERRLVCADVAAFEQVIVYNRFGSYNPFGMLFALRRDLIPADTVPVRITAADCAEDTGTDRALSPLDAGAVRLRDCKRPRPLVLRANEGDLLALQVTNLLRPGQPGHSETFCRGAHLQEGSLAKNVRDAVSAGPDDRLAHHEAACLDGTAGADPEDAAPGSADWPVTRGMSFAIEGLIAVAPDGLDPTNLAVCRGLAAVAPGEAVTCYYEIDRVGPYFFSSNAAPAGGEGDGGSITHGLFGAVVVEERGSRWFRSQVSQAAFDAAWTLTESDASLRRATGDHRRTGEVDYDAEVDGIPVLSMTRLAGGGAQEIVHTDLNAVVHEPDANRSFREFSVFFHDELKTFYTQAFEELERYGQLAGVRDGFAINYGSSGMGSILLANRKGIGPATECVECLYEEFFLTSWANGDPALLERYADDPSNVHHSYLNDEILFRNFHAGPKETHVFHLHAHQWFGGNDGNRGAYLDSQTVAPQQGFTYNIYSGGLGYYDEGPEDDWLQNDGSGNRNRTVGDSIFHCHLYPHFAQGMWELWRVHDVLEDGTRLLPDGQPEAGLSVEAMVGDPRVGSVDPETGRWIADAEGTPVPALVPLPTRPLPVLPTYAAPDEEPYLTAESSAAFPGYPFFVGGKPGHRPPQAPLDLAVATRDVGDVTSGDILDGGLSRHVVAGGTRRFGVEDAGDPPPANGAQASQLVAKMLALGDMSAEFETITLEPRAQDGTPLERAAMGFHYDGTVWSTGETIDVRAPDGTPAAFDPAGGYRTGAGLFTVNGSAPKPGAPFADPCGAPPGLARGSETDDPFLQWPGEPFRTDPAVGGFRRYEASAVQLDLVTNRAGWHDPQARINVLTSTSDDYKTNNSGLADPISPFVSAREEPFFFRAFSSECIEFRHTNELPKELELDDFQVKTPTDTIGQHIHLVKFDVTSSDGSGNGFNYEDGTFAPDEVAARICTSGQDDPRCALPEFADHKLWTLKRSDHPDWFQTTVQRWFADPILSNLGPEDADGMGDRTLRTVFSHDHFGPSSIQQHGFYTALVIEPRDNDVCRPGFVSAGAPSECRSFAGDLGTLETDNDVMVGVHRVLLADDVPGMGDDWPGPDPIHPDVREYAISIADFALLYDPRDYDTDAEAVIDDASAAGIAKLACEARHWTEAEAVDGTCGSALASDAEGRFDGADPIPAWNAAGRPGDSATHIADLADMMDGADADKLAFHLEDYRSRASLRDDGRLASPVAAPARPESISVDHHDPYLVNYRGEPIPLRIGTKESGSHDDCALATLPVQGHEAVNDDATFVRDVDECSYAVQRGGEEGDMANVFLSSLHGDPATLPIETYSGETTYIRMIQGAQEVQHTFGIAGHAWKRNLDQPFPQASPVIGAPPASETAKQACNRLEALHRGYPEFYRAWFEGRLPDDGMAPEAPSDVTLFFASLDEALATCMNAEGYVAAQEIGISEHFEVSGTFRQLLSTSGLSGEGLELLGSCSVAEERTGRCVRPRDGTIERQSTDYLYDFGTQDALWNGAWGLLRVFRNGNSPDLTTCMRKDEAEFDECAKEVFWRLREIREMRHSRGAPMLSFEEDEALFLECPEDAPRLNAAVAAIEARKVYGADGMTYGRDTFDPDGLMMVALDPNLVTEGASRADIEAAIAAMYADRPAEPYVLPVRAGDCVTLEVVNLLEPAGDEDDVVAVSGGGYETAADAVTGLRDGPGDALMPPITPLNTDPAVHVGEETASPIYELDAESTDPRKHDVTPSARLAIRFPLPTLSHTQRIALPFGWNATGALQPAGDTVSFSDETDETESVTGFLPRVANAERITFYAGKLSADPRAVLGDETASEIVHWMPYAFGPVPIEPFGDVIGHGGHGLIGSVLVLPQDHTFGDGSESWQLPGASYDVMPAPIAAGHGLATTQAKGAEGGSRRHRSFVLFFQDGLNLHDKRSGIEWRFSDGVAVASKATPDCMICDDSYDRGDQGVSYHSAPFQARLRDIGTPAVPGMALEADSDLNAVAFPSDFWMLQPDEEAAGAGGWGPSKVATSMPVLRAEAGEEVTMNVLEPSGRARQHAFVTISQDYDDLFPGFGFPHSALIAPGKAIAAPLTRPVQEGCYLWHDGPTHLRAGGIWGLLDVVPQGSLADAGVTSCRLE
ncbi:hypothetical protein EF888_14450 [Silicimonas algicola]|uniref:hypothetical protein n=1 Tax=Silicimonas algicola TaxID=1826607 RepID=UPI000D6CF723|nr:hypothetical protein [Silicimonas algicola]AZQ68231.1 hypothetical protein EF888_14450 [Silicimonas algicola]